MSVEEPNVIDFVAHDPGGTVVLVMVEGRDWDGSDTRLFQLQEKINAYVSFVTEGQLLDQSPELIGKPVRLELRCMTLPDRKTADFLGAVRDKLEDAGLPFRTQQIR